MAQWSEWSAPRGFSVEEAATPAGAIEYQGQLEPIGQTPLEAFPWQSAARFGLGTANLAPGAYRLRVRARGDTFTPTAPGAFRFPAQGDRIRQGQTLLFSWAPAGEGADTPGESAYGPWVEFEVLPAELPPPPPPPPAPPAEPAAALARLEIWTALECAGGERLAFAAADDVLRASDTRELNGRESITVTTRHTPELWGAIRERRALRVVYETGAVDEWVITNLEQHRTSDGSATIQLRGGSPLHELTDADLVQRREADGRITLDFDLYGLTPAEHIDVIRASLPEWVFPGEIESTDRVDVSYSALSPLAALRAVAEAAGCELEFTRAGADGYLVHIREERGGGREPARLRYAKNLSSTRRSTNTDPLATRVYPTGASEDGFISTIGPAAWEVVGVAGGRIQLAGGPIAWDDQLDGLYAESLASRTRAEIIATHEATQQLEIGDTTGFQVGDLVAIRADAAGTELTHLDRPGAETLKVRRIERSDIPAINNLAPTPFLDEWDGAMPARWHAAGSSASIAEEPSGLFRRHGRASAYLLMTGEGQGIESDWFPVSPSAASPYFTAQASIYMVTGAVRLELEVEDSAGVRTTYPGEDLGPAYTSQTGTWVDGLAINGLDLLAVGARRARLRIVAHRAGRTEAYLDAVQVTQTAGGASIYWGGRAANDLWRAGLEYLAAHAGPEVSYSVDLVDLQRLDPAAFEFDELVLGGPVEVADTGLDINVTTRLVAITRDLLTPGVTSVQLASVAETLSGRSAQRPMRPPRGWSGAPGAGSAPQIVDAYATYIGAQATVHVRANPAAFALWHEERIGGTWGSRTRFATGQQGTFSVLASPAAPRFFRVAASDEGGALGPWREVPIARYDEIPDALQPPDLFARSMPGSELDTADIHGRIRDAAGGEVTLYAWTNRDAYGDPDPTGPPDGQVTLQAPADFGPGTTFGSAGQLLNEVRSHPGEPKTVYLEAVASDGRTSGRIAVEIRTRLSGLVDRLGELEAGSIHRWSQFADQYQPPLLFATEDQMRAATGVEEGRRAVTRDDGKEWRRTASGWVEEQMPRAEGFFPALTSGSIRAAYMHADMGEYVEVRAERVAADVVEAQALDAVRAQIGTLDELTQDMGIVVAGRLVSQDGSVIVDMNAQGGNPILQAGNFLSISRTGAAFTGTVTIGPGTTFADPDFDPRTKETPQGAGEKADAALLAAKQYTDSVIAGSGVGDGTITIRIGSGETGPQGPQIRPGPPVDGQPPPLRVGDVWIDTDAGDRPHSWDGTAWIRMYTRIDGGDIETGIVSANRLQIGPGTTFVDPDYDPTTKESIAGATQRAIDTLQAANDYTDAAIAGSGAGSGNVIIRSNSQPGSRVGGADLVPGDIWLDTTNNRDLPYSWAGGSAGWVRMYTSIDGGDIRTGVVAANRVRIGSGTTFDSDAYNPALKITAGQAESIANNVAATMLQEAQDYVDEELQNAGALTATRTWRAAPRSSGAQPRGPLNRPDGLPLRPGDVWLNTAEGDLPFAWSGTAWIPMFTQIDGGRIRTGTVDAAKFTTLQLTAGQWIRSTTYTPGSVGWNIHANGSAEFNNVTVRGTVYASAGEFSGRVTANEFRGSNPEFTGRIIANGIDLHPTTIGQTRVGMRVYSETSGLVGEVKGNPSGHTYGQGLELRGIADIMLNNYQGPGFVGATKVFGYFDMYYGASNYWRWDPGFAGGSVPPGAGANALKLSKNNTLRYIFGEDGRAYADLGWNTFSPEPPKPADQMGLRDWLSWAAEDAAKPVKPYEGLPSAEHPEVQRLAESRGITVDEAVSEESTRYGKDVSKIAIGTGMALKMLADAAMESESWQEFRAKIMAN